MIDTLFILCSDFFPIEIVQLLFADSNGSFKDLVFPKALDLDRPKRARTTFSPEQLYHLEREFQRNQYMIGKDRSQLAQELGLSETQVILIMDYFYGTE
jgi:hypothetical protein